MGRRIIGLVIGLVVAAAASAALGMPAGAGGGSRLQPDREFYRPGDPVHLAGDVYKQDRDWFGPYTVYIRPMLLEETGEYVEAGRHPGDVAVGRLVIARIDPSQVRAEVTFVLPKVPDGMYQVDYCGPDCTKRVGDLYASWFYVGSAPYVAPTSIVPTTVPTTRAVPVTTGATAVARNEVASAPSVEADAVAIGAAGPRTDDSSTGSGWWWLAGIAVLVGGAAAIAGFRGRGPRRTITRSGAPMDAPGPGDDVVVVGLDGPSSDEPIGAGR